MKVLVIGGGGREHALVWKISQSSLVKNIYCAPGNAGIAELAECLDIKPDDIPRLINFAKRNRIDLTVVGPEAPLAQGIVNVFIKEKLKIFGPTQKAAILESSKVFSKQLMRKYAIPTANFHIFNDSTLAKKFLYKFNAYPIVIKANGLAAGKGVMICKTYNTAKKGINTIMQEKVFGDAGKQVVIEEFLKGEELSIICLTDSKNIIVFEPSQDHKPVFDNDEGPNTGGMGAYSPVPLFNSSLQYEIEKQILVPIVHAMKTEGRPFRGTLYAGLISTRNGVKVLEFNVRFGDPETQPLMMRLKSDLIPLLMETVRGELNKVKMEWDKRSAVCVVMVSKGYPGAYKKGFPIEGLNDVKKMKDVVVFHAGTKKTNGNIVTNGGRVLGITALGDTIEDARKRVYKAVNKIHFEGVHYRKDIGAKALRYMKK